MDNEGATELAKGNWPGLKKISLALNQIEWKGNMHLAYGCRRRSKSFFEGLMNK